MRRFHIVPVLVAVAVLGGGAALGAQDTRVQRKIVIPQEVLVEVQRLAGEVLGEIQLGDLSREITRAMADLSRDLGHFSGAVLGGSVLPQDRDFRAEQTDRQTKTLPIGANGWLDLRNVVGNITVKAGGGREATVEIVRVSRGRTDADARLGLERVTAAVSTRGERGSVSVDYPNERRPGYAVSVSMTVTAPAGTGLTVHSITGDVSIAGFKGEVTANTTTGALEVSQAANVASARTVTGRLVIRDSQSDGTLEAGTMSGSVQLSNIKARRLEVNAVTASIVARDIQAGGAEVTCMSGQIEYTGPVVAGGRYEFQAHNGEIRLGLTGAFDFEAQTFSGQIDTDPSLGFKSLATNERTGLGMRHQSLKGSVGGGGASVEATTFSGRIRVGRTVPESTGRRGRGL